MAVLGIEDGDAARERERPAGHGREPLAGLAREGAGRVGAVALHQDAELVAAEPAGERAGVRLRRRGERRAGRDQRAVAGGVAVEVVDLLERVEVAEQQRELAVQRLGARDGLLEPDVERAPVRQPRQRVLVRERLEPREQLGAADRRRDLRAQRLGEADVRGAERWRAGGGVRLQHAPDPIAVGDRAGQHRAALDPLEEVALGRRDAGVGERHDVRLGEVDEPAVERAQRPRLERRPRDPPRDAARRRWRGCASSRARPRSG